MSGGESKEQLITPIKDGENFTFSEQTHNFGDYKVTLHRRDRAGGSGVTLEAGEEKPLRSIYDKIMDASVNVAEEQEWAQLYFVLGSLAKWSGPESDKQGKYRLRFWSNYEPTADFVQNVVKPLVKFKVIPETSIQLLS